jgi:hypothetical protein
MTINNNRILMDQKLPSLVLALYNREEAALRSLESISAARYPGRDVRLVISIDNDSNKNENIERVAREYNWKHGEKEVIYHKQKLGLREHFNFCGDLTQKYGTVIFLEDDLFVSPHYYDYALQALDFYRGDDRVAGISLFSYHRLDQGGNPPPFFPSMTAVIVTSFSRHRGARYGPGMCGKNIKNGTTSAAKTNILCRCLKSLML